MWVKKYNDLYFPYATQYVWNSITIYIFRTLYSKVKNSTTIYMFRTLLGMDKTITIYIFRTLHIYG